MIIDSASHDIPKYTIHLMHVIWINPEKGGLPNQWSVALE